MENLYIWFDYEVLLPFFALLPNRLGRYLAKLRGILYFHKKRDWRSFTFGDVEVYNRTYESYKQIFPELPKKNISDLVKERYIYQSFEEFEAAKINNKTYMKVPLKYIGKEAVESYLRENPNAIFATCHFGSIVGLINLHVFGKPMLHLASNVTKQTCVHPSITKFYIKKYRIGDKYMNGGEIVDIEENTKRFFKFVKNGGSLSTVADLPATNPDKEAFWQNWFGRDRALSAGIHHLSAKTQTKIIPYVCYYQKGKYIMKFAKLEEDIYSFFEKEIRQKPGMWWASDLLSHYKVR
jgi:lauroyl/myristoyl acyltransferase